MTHSGHVALEAAWPVALWAPHTKGSSWNTAKWANADWTGLQCRADTWAVAFILALLKTRWDFFHGGMGEAAPNRAFLHTPSSRASGSSAPNSRRAHGDYPPIAALLPHTARMCRAWLNAQHSPKGRGGCLPHVPAWLPAPPDAFECRLEVSSSKGHTGRTQFQFCPIHCLTGQPLPFLGLCLSFSGMGTGVAEGPFSLDLAQGPNWEGGKSYKSKRDRMQGVRVLHVTSRFFIPQDS